MGKYKAVKKKTDAPPQIKPGVPCIIIVLGVFVAVLILMFLVIRSA
jgi:hypothetical protein